MKEWFKTSESLPQTGDDVLVFLNGRQSIASVEESRDGEGYWDSDDDRVHGLPVDSIPFWRALPEPPLLDAR